MKKNPYRLLKTEEIRSSSLLAVWNEDEAGMELRIFDYLMSELKGEEFCRVSPAGFFPLDGVKVRDDVATIPESKFYQCNKNFMLFLSEPPQFEWHRFLNLLIDIGETYCGVKEIYTIGKIISLCAHTAPREFFGVFCSEDFKNELCKYGICREVDYFTPPDQRPTYSSYLTWVAERRGIPAVSLWVTVPFYLARTGDPRALKKVLQFLNERQGLSLDFTLLNKEIKEQGARIAQLQMRSPKVDEYIKKLESNLPLTDEETMRLANEVEEYLGT